MTRPSLYLAGAAALIVAVALAIWLSHTGIATDSRKESKAKAARQQAAITSATTAYHTAQAHEDSARRPAAIVPMRPTDTARVRRILTDAFRH